MNARKPRTNAPSKKIAILGAGFGGLRAAMVLGTKIRRMGLKDCRITLVDRNDFQTFSPLLYEVSTTPKEIADYLNLKSLVTFPLEKVLRDRQVELVQDTVRHLDLVDGKIALASGRDLDYDYLIIALGVETRFFDTDRLQEATMGLKSFNDAITIRDAIWQSSCTARHLSIVVCGGGPTGVELSGELQGWLNEISRLGRCQTGITLIHAGPTVLSRFPHKVANKVAARLARLNVNVIANDRIVAIQYDDNTIRLESGRIVMFDMLIWTGGVKLNEVLGNLPVKYENGRISVADDLAVVPADEGAVLHGKVYGIGDAVSCHYSQSGQEVPMLTWAAVSEASVAARNVIADILDKPAAPYKPMHYPYVIPVGGKYAVARVGPVTLSGYSAWFFKELVEFGYLVSILPAGYAWRIWFRELRIFTQNDNLG